MEEMVRCKGPGAGKPVGRRAVMVVRQALLGEGSRPRCTGHVGHEGCLAGEL